MGRVFGIIPRLVRDLGLAIVLTGCVVSPAMAGNNATTIIKVYISANPEPVVQWDIDGKTFYEGETFEVYTSTHVRSEVCMSDKP